MSDDPNIDDPNIEVVSPLALLDTIARRHSCRVGVLVAPLRLAPLPFGGPLRRQRVAALEVRAGGGFWAARELRAVVAVGSGDLCLEEAASELLASLGRQGWLDAGESR